NRAVARCSTTTFATRWPPTTAIDPEHSFPADARRIGGRLADATVPCMTRRRGGCQLYVTSTYHDRPARRRGRRGPAEGAGRRPGSFGAHPAWPPHRCGAVLPEEAKTQTEPVPLGRPQAWRRVRALRRARGVKRRGTRGPSSASLVADTGGLLRA